MEATGSGSDSRRWRLEAGPPSQGPAANPVAEVLFNTPTLLAKIHPVGEADVKAAQREPWEPSASLGAFRAVCKDARAAFDAACEAPLVYGQQRQDMDAGAYLAGHEPLGPGPSEALDWALGMLRRGRRPTAVRFWTHRFIDPEGWRQGALDLLRAIPQLSGRPGEGVASLELPSELLSPSTAPLIAGAFPNLARLELTEEVWLSPDASHKAARGLALLLGVPSAAEGDGGASGGADGEAAARDGGEGSGPINGSAPLLPRLAALRLGLTSDMQLLPGFAVLLHQATQLRTVEIKGGSLNDGDQQGQAGDGRGLLEELASLTLLKALSLHSCAVPLLPALTGALTHLTSLELGDQDDTLSLELFAPLQGLQKLEVPRASLEVTGLAEALSSLTRLSVGGFTLPAQELRQPLTSIPRWQLPAGLRELGLGTGSTAPPVPPEVLTGLELPAGLRLERKSALYSFILRPGRHTAAPVVEGGGASAELLPAAEEALCGALRFVHRHGLLKGRKVTIFFKCLFIDRLLRPVGGAAGTGPGRPNHGRWLREVAALGPERLLLDSIQLSYQDVEVIRDHMKSLKALEFLPCRVPLPALHLLGALPLLEELVLDSWPWSGRDPASSELRGQALASIVALAHVRAPAPPLTLDMRYVVRLSRHDKQRVRQLGLRARQEIREWGLDPVTVLVGGTSLDAAQESEEPDDSDHEDDWHDSDSD